MNADDLASDGIRHQRSTPDGDGTAEQLRLLGQALAPIAEGVLIVDVSGHLAYINPAGQFLARGLLSDDRPVVEQIEALDIRLPSGPLVNAEEWPLARALQGEAVVDAVFVYRKPNGAKVLLKTTSGPVRDEKGSLIGAYALFRDITEQWQTKEDLRDSEARLRGLFAALSDGIVVAGLDRTIVECNEAALRMFGWEREELIGRNVYEFLAPEDRERAAAEADVAIEEGFVHSEVKALRKDGRTYDVEIDLSPLRDASGQPVAFVGAVRDITERKRAAEALAWEAGVNAAMADLSRALISATGEDTAWLVLQHAKRLTGSQFGFTGYIDPHTGWFVASTFTRDIWDVCRVENKDVVLRQFNGLWGWVLKHRRPILTNDPSADPRAGGTPSGHIPIRRFLAAPALMGDTLVGMVALANADRDYNERDLALVQRLAALYAVAVQQQRLAELRDQFLQLAAHELRTPLTVLKGYADFLAKRMGHDEAEAQAVRALKAHTDRVARLVQAMLDVVHIQGGGLTLKREPLDLCALAREVAATLQTDAPRHPLVVVGEGRVTVVGDGQRLGTVLWHLVQNAVHFSPKGGPVQITVAAREGEAVVSVRDFGPGVPLDKREEIFEAFYQMAPSASPAKGMGLGLYISREIIGRHGGRVWVESEPGLGSTFSFALPLAPSPRSV